MYPDNELSSRLVFPDGENRNGWSIHDKLADPEKLTCLFFVDAFRKGEEYITRGGINKINRRKEWITSESMESLLRDGIVTEEVGKRTTRYRLNATLLQYMDLMYDE
jgi:hypothetical protein